MQLGPGELFRDPITSKDRYPVNRHGPLQAFQSLSCSRKGPTQNTLCIHTHSLGPGSGRDISQGCSRYGKIRSGTSGILQGPRIEKARRVPTTPRRWIKSHTGRVEPHRGPLNLLRYQSVTKSKLYFTNHSDWFSSLACISLAISEDRRGKASRYTQYGPSLPTIPRLKVIDSISLLRKLLQALRQALELIGLL